MAGLDFTNRGISMTEVAGTITTWRAWRWEDVGLTETCARLLPPTSDAVPVIGYGTKRAFFGEIRSGAMHGHEEAGLVYEARIFHQDWELRWLQGDYSGMGVAALRVLGDNATAPTDEPEHDRAVVRTLEQSYLLWGSATGQHHQEGWSTMSEARISAYDLPCHVPEQGRVLLGARECLGALQHGNVVVIDELLTSLRVRKGAS